MSITFVYRMTAYAPKGGHGLKNYVIGNDNTVWDNSISMNKGQNFIVSNAKENLHHLVVVIIQ